MIIIKKDEKIADIYIPKNESWVDYTVVDIRKLQSKDLKVVENGIVEVLPDDEYYALSSVEINVDVPSAAPQLEELYATENGEYIPNGDGYNRVVVDVPQTGGECNLQDKIVEPTVDDLEENWLYVRPDEGYDGMRGISIYTSNLEDAWKSESNLEDKWVTPSKDEIDGNGYIVIEPSEGFNGLSRVVIDPRNLIS